VTDDARPNRRSNSLVSILTRPIGQVLGLRRVFAILGRPDPAWSLPPSRAIYVQSDGAETTEVVLTLTPHVAWIARAGDELNLDDDVNRYMVDVWFDLRAFDATQPLDLRIGKDIIAASWTDARANAMISAFHRIHPRDSAFSITADLDTTTPAIHIYIPSQLVA
jgi:hypothetical protein